MRKGSFIAALALSILLGIGAIGAGASGTAPGKKRCHFVKKKVHGKLKRVRVCTKQKPKPKPAAKPVNVSLSLDSTHAASTVVGAAGGNVEHGLAASQRIGPEDVGELVAANQRELPHGLVVKMPAMPKNFRVVHAQVSCRSRGRQRLSKMPAAPMPVPMHIVTMPYFCLRRRRPCTRVAVRMAPVAPSG